MSRKKHVRKIAYFCTILVLVLVMLYSGLRILESTVFHPEPSQGETNNSKTIIRDGISYFPRQDITVMMVLGIDQFGPVADSGSYNNSGAADMVMLLILDQKNEKCDVLCLNRDTVMDIPVLGIGGKEAGTVKAQLALAHTYGSGLEDSCENTRKAVSDYLYGITIDHYVSMNMDAITVLNDAVGGVTVNVVDDFSAVDPTITKGEVTLRGQQAINYVRTRKDVGDQLNISRIQRQKEYVEGFLEAMQTKQETGEDFVASAYEEVSPYIVTDCSVTTISSLMSRFSDYSLDEIIVPEGENVLTGQYYEFYADEDKLDELILRLFYAPK